MLEWLFKNNVDRENSIIVKTKECDCGTGDLVKVISESR